MTQSNISNTTPLDKVYQQLADAGSIQRSQLLEIVRNDKVAARALYEDLKQASMVTPIGDTQEVGEVPPELALTDFGMAFLISKGYSVRP
ncbi:hypothetical protein ACFS7Z_24895 [Pontibacter toksunensis]|uniref:Uncharacterized protein n=1 Tax=Pontibacter toksunensis TaxID=1332631 RepID=A0ABW6C783_9BACT